MMMHSVFTIGVLVTGVLTALLLMFSSDAVTVSLPKSIVHAQLANTTEVPSVDQTTILANLSLEDFEEVANDLGAAREDLENNDTIAAYAGLSSASMGLYESTDDGEQSIAISKELDTLHKRIINGLEALWNYDTTQTFRQINAADKELVNITQRIPESEVANEED